MKHTPGPWTVDRNNASVSVNFHTSDRQTYISVDKCDAIPDDYIHKPYPRVIIGNVAWFPDMTQLIELHDKIGKYIAAEPVDRQNASTDTDVDEQHKKESR